MAASNLASIFYSAHLMPRLLLGLSLLTLATLAVEIALGLLLSSIAIILIYFVEQSWRRVVRILKLLRWCIVPILLLHILFSSGQYLFPGMPIPLTREGLMRGLQLSIHLSSIFFSASFLFLCLRQHEWFKFILALPFIHHEKSVSYMLTMMPMRNSVKAVVDGFQQQWHLRKHWKDVPLLLVSIFRSTLAAASDQAEQLWLRWPSSSQFSDRVVRGKRFEIVMANMLCVGAGLLGLILAWNI